MNLLDTKTDIQYTDLKYYSKMGEDFTKFMEGSWYVHHVKTLPTMLAFHRKDGLSPSCYTSDLAAC